MRKTVLILRGASRADIGFTLLELLIALSILAVLATLMTGGLRFGLTVWEKGTALAERSAELIIAQRFIRDRVNEALPLIERDKAGGRIVAFDGRADTLRLVTDHLAHATIGGPFLVEFGTSETEDARGLIVKWRELDPDMSDFRKDGDADVSLLLADATRATFSYFGTLRDSNKNAWQTSWTDRGELPLLVRLNLDFPRTSHRLWPELVAATHVQAVGLR